MRSIMATRRGTFPRRRRAHWRRALLGPRGPLARSSKNLQKQFRDAAETADDADHAGGDAAAALLVDDSIAELVEPRLAADPRVHRVLFVRALLWYSDSM